jgi:FtsP/CotA-like multicopper oxidase with cupredoxin domain
MVRLRTLACCSTLLGLACVPAPVPELVEATPTLVAARDLSADPTIVEVDLIAEVGEVEYLDGTPTAVWGFRDGGEPDAPLRVPGPLIRARVGDRLIVHFHNRLDVPTTVHWHGLRLPEDMDGNPMVSGVVLPGGDFEYDFVLQDAGTFWYHPHVDVDEQVELGLHGQLLVEDPEDPPVSADRLFELDADAEIVLEPDELDVMLGRVGNVLLVNGRPPATLEVPAGGHERWRFVNAANGRHFELALRDRETEDRVPLQVVGWDGGRMSAAYVVESLLIAPGERYELLVELPDKSGGRWLLETLPVERGEGLQDAGPFDLVDVRIGPALDDPSGLARAEDFAREITTPEVTDATPERSFVLRHDEDPIAGQVFFINDQLWPQNSPVEVELGATEVWLVENLSPHPHPFHIHGLFFEVLDVDGLAPPVVGRKDTVGIPGESTARLAVRYEAPGMWMFHCTIPEHAERGMMGDLMVIPP